MLLTDVAVYADYISDCAAYDVAPLAEGDVPQLLPTGPIYYGSAAFNSMYPTNPTAFGDYTCNVYTNNVSDLITFDFVIPLVDVGSSHYTITYTNNYVERVGFVIPSDIGVAGFSDDDIFPIYRLYPVTFSDQEVPSEYQYWLYAFDLTAHGLIGFTRGDDFTDIPVYRIPLDYLASHPALEYPDFETDLSLPNTGGGLLIWLESLGESLLSSNPLLWLLELDIGGVPFLELVLTSGFAVYAAWVIFKFFLPF